MANRALSTRREADLECSLYLLQTAGIVLAYEKCLAVRHWDLLV